MSSTMNKIDECVRTIMHNARSIPIRVPMRGPSEGPPGDLGEVTTADDMQRFEGVLRTKLMGLVRSLAASKKREARR
ncbi:MAG: hypothetical protein ACK4WH_13075 [Phycisphaerales bacterium]